MVGPVKPMALRVNSRAYGSAYPLTLSYSASMAESCICVGLALSELLCPATGAGAGNFGASSGAFLHQP